MKITKEQLKRIIKEELKSVLEGQSNDMTQFGLQGPGDWGTHSQPAWETVAASVYHGWKQEQASDKIGSSHTDLADWLGPDPASKVDPYIATYMDEAGMPDDLSTTSPEMSALADKVVAALKHGWQPED
tara:strand:+ start:230 stop:616 length:387 start_codon:yes stop_codon:yes gene_type:complete